jgi:hypothetical protein
MSLETLIRVVQEFFGSITALLRGTLHHSHPVLDRIGNRVGCARSLPGRFGDVSCRFFRYRL